MKTIILSSILSMLLSTGNPVVFQNPSNIIATPYGTCTFYYSLSGLEGNDSSIFNGIVFGSDINMTVVNYEFTGQATGTFDLACYEAVLNNAYRIFVEGGYLLSVPDRDGNQQADALRFRVVDSTHFTVVIIHPNWNQVCIRQPALENQSISIGDTIETDIDNIVSYTLAIDGYCQTINSSTTAIRNVLLQSLGAYVSNEGSLYTDMNTLIEAFNIVKTIDENILWSSNLPQYSKTFINTMMWYNNGTSGNNKSNFFNDIYGTYLTIPGNTYIYDTYLLTGFKYIMLYAVNRDVSTIRPIFTSSNVTANVTRTLRSHNLTYYMVEITVTSSNRYTFTMNATTEFNMYPLYLGTDWSIPDDLMFITRNAFHNMYISALNSIKSAIDNMSLNVNQLTVNATGITYNVNETEVDNSITNYNTSITSINTIENDFAGQFNDQLDLFNPSDISAEIPITTNLINTSTFMNNIAGQLFGLDIIKYPVILMLVGIVIIAILG